MTVKGSFPQTWVQESMAEAAALYVMLQLKDELNNQNNWAEWEFIDPETGEVFKPARRLSQRLNTIDFEWMFPYVPI